MTVKRSPRQQFPLSDWDAIREAMEELKRSRTPVNPVILQELIKTWRKRTDDLVNSPGEIKDYEKPSYDVKAEEIKRCADELEQTLKIFAKLTEDSG